MTDKKGSRADLTPDTIKRILRCQERTGIKATRFMRQFSHIAPAGLSAPIIETWVYGSVKTAEREYIDFVLKHYAEIEQEFNALQARECLERIIKTQTEKVEITPEILAELKHHRKRTNKAPMALLKGLRAELPKGLTSAQINNWMAGVKTVKKEYLDYVLRLWREMPDYMETPEILKAKDPRVPVTPEIIQEIRFHQRRTGVKANGFMRQFRSSAPEGLTDNIIQSWTDGGTKTIKTEHLDFVLESYAKMKQQRITLTFPVTDQFKACELRTGIKSFDLLDHASAPPDGLTSAIITGWVKRETRTARKDYFDYVLTLWKSLPDS